LNRLLVASQGVASSLKLDEALAPVIKAVADSAGTAASIAAQIRVALHNVSITLPSPWKALDCQELAVFEYAENVSGKQIWHTGAVYQLRATQ